MRDDDALLDQAAGLVLAGDIAREDYHEIWATVMAERMAELPLPDQSCGHPWSDGQRVWVDHVPGEDVRCRVCIQRCDSDTSSLPHTPEDDGVHAAAAPGPLPSPTEVGHSHEARRPSGEPVLAAAVDPGRGLP